MHPRLLAMQRIFGAIIALSSLITVPPLIIAWSLGEPSLRAFVDSFLLIGGAGRRVTRTTTCACATAS